jgi:HK97 family phage major capsid protein
VTEPVITIHGKVLSERDLATKIREGVTPAATSSSMDAKRPPRDNLVRAQRGGYEVRDNGDGDGRTLVGHFAVFNEWTEINSNFEGHFMERIAPGSFAKTFQESPPKVTFNHGHDPELGDKVLGSIRSLAEDDVGAAYEVGLFDGLPSLLMSGLRAGEYGASFRFGVMRERFDRDPGTSDWNPDGIPERTILEARVPEFGPVSFPQYESATAGVRSLTDEFIFDGFANDPKRLVELIDNTRALTLKSLKGEDPEPEPAPAEATPEPVSVETHTKEAQKMEIDQYTSVEALNSRDSEVKSRITALDSENAGREFSPEVRAEWDDLNSEHDAITRRVQELEARKARIEEIGGDPDKTVGPQEPQEPKKPFGVIVKPNDIYDLGAYRTQSRSREDEAQLLRDGARRSIETSQFPHARANHEDVQGHVERLLAFDDDQATIARRILATGSATYQRAFGKHLMVQPLTDSESRALSLTTTAGGFAVPYVLDPTIIPTSNLSVNPFRAISRVIPITVDDWKGVSSAGITAAFAAEATETTDNAPTVAQPSISTEKAQAFVPYSIEIGMDWGGLLSEMAGLLQDAKDDLEATKFTLGTGTNEPFGLIVGATTLTITTTTGAFVIADLYKVEEALLPRHRPRASIVGNRFVFNKIRQFDTSGGSGVWMDGLQPGLANAAPVQTTPFAPRVLGYPAYENTAMDAVLTTGSEILVIGDFSRFVIIDRIGLNIETIQHLVSTNHRPTGQRGLYAYWRTGSKVVDAGAFRTLQT